MPILTMLNQKGGVGKTSLVFHLAGELARRGLKVIAADNDPQGSLTQGFFGPAGAAEVAPEESLSAVYAGGDHAPFADQLARPGGMPGLSVIPSSWALADFNRSRPHEADFREQQALDAFLHEPILSGLADWVLVDCPPNLHLLSWAALAASDALLVPVQAEDFGAQGIGPVLDFFRAVKQRSNPDLRVAGLAITMFDRRPRLPGQYADLLRKKYGPAVIEPPIPRAIDFPEAINRRKPLCRHRPKGAGALAVAALADELIHRTAPAPAPTPAA